MARDEPGAPRRAERRRRRFYLGRLIRLDPELVGSAVGELLGLWHTGAFTPLVGAELPLEEVERAHELIESRGSVGKVVLVP